MIFHRFSENLVKTALVDTPVVVINGPRQCGKTTLVKTFSDRNRVYLTLDDDTVAAAAEADPAGFVRGIPGNAIIDEVQRAPALLRAIKQSVDENRQPGRFLLTGSADILALPNISESLAGRMEIINLLPLSRAEIQTNRPTFLTLAFEGQLPDPRQSFVADTLLDAVLAGGFPEMVQRNDFKRRQAWARNYIQSIVQRDLRDIAEIEKLDRVPRLLRALAHHAAQLTNFSQLGGEIGLDGKTTHKYITVLEQVFLVRRIDAWHRNRLKRLIKTPKLHFLDSGLLASLLGANPAGIARDRTLYGPLLETFALSEILKQISWDDTDCDIHHYRDKDKDEVDIVIEDRSGAVVGLEVKAAATVTSKDFKGLRKLAAATGKDFRIGVVLYDGERIVPFGDSLFAAPVSCIWS